MPPNGSARASSTSCRLFRVGDARVRRGVRRRLLRLRRDAAAGVLLGSSSGERSRTAATRASGSERPRARNRCRARSRNRDAGRGAGPRRARRGGRRGAEASRRWRREGGAGRGAEDEHARAAGGWPRARRAMRSALVHAGALSSRGERHVAIESACCSRRGSSRFSRPRSSRAVSLRGPAHCCQIGGRVSSQGPPTPLSPFPTPPPRHTVLARPGCRARTFARAPGARRTTTSAPASTWTAAR